MTKRLILLVSFLLLCISSKAINMKVGDTETLDIGNISYLKGCMWTISRPNDVVFTSSPSNYSTRATIKAVHSFPSTSPCIVQCEYSYYDLDPTTGRYTYLRSGYKDWTIFVSDDDNNNDNNDTATGIIIEPSSASINVDEWVTLTASVQNASSIPKLSWKIEDTNVAYYTQTQNHKINVRGIKEGNTRISVTTPNGKTAYCNLEVKSKEYEVGEYFTAKTIEGIELTFRAMNSKTCYVQNSSSNAVIPTSTTGTITIPDKVNGYTVTVIGWGAFAMCKSLSRIEIPNTVREIHSDSFFGCSNLETIIIPNSVNFIDGSAFAGCSSAKQIILSENLTYLGPNAFRSCTQLQNLVIPEGVESISLGICSGCENLISITLPNSLTTINGLTGKDAAFYNCKKLSTVYSYIENPFPINKNIFYIDESSPNIINAKLYVLKGKKELYSQVNGWKNFKEIVELGESTKIENVIINNLGGNIYSVGGNLIRKKGCNINLTRGIYIQGNKKLITK
ncbi:leucine-rich repeat protein [bacterium]|nr:leucine-rich repeat protein [bacterium]